MKTLVAAVLAVWLVAVLWLGAAGRFENPSGTPPIPILIGAAGPVVVFLVAYWWSAAFQAYVLSVSLPLATAIQGWRAGGLVFLALYAHGLLPGPFAWPAGLGDIAIGVTAPWVMIQLVRQPAFARSPVFVTWNWLGILDLVVAVGMGGLSSFLASGAPGEISIRPMAQLPLVLIPAYLVPLFLMLHFTALFQSRELRSTAG